MTSGSTAARGHDFMSAPGPLPRTRVVHPCQAQLARPGEHGRDTPGTLLR